MGDTKFGKLWFIPWDPTVLERRLQLHQLPSVEEMLEKELLPNVITYGSAIAACHWAVENVAMCW